MRWIQNMSSSQSSLSPSSTSSSPRTKNNSDRIEPKLTRQKNLRYLSEQEIANAVNLPLPEGESSMIGSPQPLPLPQLAVFLRKKHSFSSSTSEISDCPLPSPEDAGILRDKEDSERRKTTEIVGRTVGRFCRGANYCQSKFKIKVSTRSVPTSPFASPLRSPGKTSNGDFLPNSYITPKAREIWSAPEMPYGEALPSFSECSAQSVDNSPIQSPSVKSPHRSPKGVGGHISPSPKSYGEVSIRHDSNALVSPSVHRLPLPPEAAMPSSSTANQKIACKLESMPLNGTWKKGKLLGRGTFGSVYVATNRETGALCAMKEVELCHDDPKSIECMKQMEQEIKVLSRLKHPNIVQYFGSEIVDDRFYIYLEYVHPGSINKYVRDHCGAMTESVVRNFTRHILSGLAYLHSKKTIHRDIKGANLLVDASGVVKLADFGMAKHLSGPATDLSLKGSPYWMAPELMQAVIQKDNNSDLALAIDIWSLGCTIIEMLTGKPPWSQYEGVAAMFKVMKDTPPIPETLSSEGKDFLHYCFKRNPAERPSASMLLEHYFLKSSPYLEGSLSSREDLFKIRSKDTSNNPRRRSSRSFDSMPF